MNTTLQENADDSAADPAIETTTNIFDRPAAIDPRLNELAARFDGCAAEAAIYREEYALAKRTFWARPVDVKLDEATIHAWMNREHVIPYWKMDWPPEKIRKYLNEATERPGFEPFIAYMDDEAFAYFEAYDPARDRIKDFCESRATDVGLHILIGEEQYMKKFIIRMSVTLMRLVFQRWRDCERIIGEPDENNRQILGLMRFLGFRFEQKIALPEKTADFLTLTRHDFERGHGTGA